MKYIPLIVSSILIVIAFFLGILFEKTKHFGELEAFQNQKYYINLEQLKTKLKIHNTHPNIIIQLNGKDFSNKQVIELLKD